MEDSINRAKEIMSQLKGVLTEIRSMKNSAMKDLPAEQYNELAKINGEIEKGFDLIAKGDVEQLEKFYKKHADKSNKQ